MSLLNPRINCSFYRLTFDGAMVYTILLLVMLSGMHGSLGLPWLVLSKYFAVILSVFVLLKQYKRIVLPPIAMGLCIMAVWLTLNGLLRDQFYGNELVRLASYVLLIIAVWSYGFSSVGISVIILFISTIEFIAIIGVNNLHDFNFNNILQIGGGRMAAESTFSNTLAVFAVFSAALRKWWFMFAAIGLCLLAGKRGATLAMLLGLIITFLPFFIKRIVLSLPTILLTNLIGIICVLSLGMSGPQQLLEDITGSKHERISMSRTLLYSGAVKKIESDSTILIIGGGAGTANETAVEVVGELRNRKLVNFHIHSDLLALLINGGFFFMILIPILLYIPIPIRFRAIVIPLNFLIVFGNPIQFAHIFIPAIALLGCATRSIKADD